MNRRHLLALLGLAFPALAPLKAPADETRTISFAAPADSAPRYWLNPAYARIDRQALIEGQPTLHLDTTANHGLWNQCFKTRPGLLKPGKSYVITLKYRNLKLDDESRLLFLLRPFGEDNNYADLAQQSGPEVNPVTPEKITIRGRIPTGRNDYSFQIHTRNRTEAVIGAITVAETDYEPEKILPPDGPAPHEAKLNTPSGATEFTIDQPRPRPDAPTLKAETFGVNPSNPDNVPALNRALDQCRKVGAARLTLGPGIYRFTSDQPILFQEMKDFEFDGGGATLVFLKKRFDMISVKSCERVLLHRFNLDWDWERDPLGSVVRVEKVGPEGAYVDFRFVDYRDFPNRNTRFAFLDLLDPKTMSVASEGGFGLSLEFFKGRNPTDAQWLSGNLLRIKDRKNYSTGFRTMLKPGQLFRLSHYYYDMNGVNMRDNAHLTLRDINLYSCPGHAFLASGDQHHWQLIRTNIIRPPGTARPITCTADHHHIGQSKGYLKIENCEFSLGQDDCLNIHDCSAYGRKTADRVMTFRNLRDSASYHPGDPIEFRAPDYTPTGFRTRLVKVSRDAARHWLLEFADPLPGPVNSDHLIFNRRYDSRQIIVRNSYFHDNRARGLLLLASDITVENNRFVRNQMGAIKIETGYTLNRWCEGYGASNIVIRNNHFDYANPRGAFSNEKRPVIYMSVYLKSDPSSLKTEYPILRDILVEKNRFTACPGVIAYACSAANVIVRDNRIENPRPRLTAFDYRGAVATSYSNGVFVTGNTWIESPYMPAPGLIIDPTTVKNTYCWANRVTKK